jgi:hypothetical protein
VVGTQGCSVMLFFLLAKLSFNGTHVSPEFSNHGRSALGISRQEEEKTTDKRSHTAYVK